MQFNLGIEKVSILTAKQGENGGREQFAHSPLPGRQHNWTSDHWPIVLETNPFKWGPTPFRQNRKFIKVLENERGLVLNNSESIKEETLKYFEKLYASPSGESWRVEGLDWSLISSESASRLESPFTEKEISMPFFSWIGIRHQGLDGFTIAVFQDCWDVIKEDLVRVFAEFHKILIANEIVDEKDDQERKELSSKLTLKRLMTMMLLRAEEINVLEGFRVGRNRTKVSHLRFADDTIFFSSTREEDMLTLKSVLLVFGHISRLKVNLDKSNIYGINLEQNHLSRLAEMLDCKASRSLYSTWVFLWEGIPRLVVFGIL
ncbi:hypothetical protein CK203_105678 [Vitis vinifera]|uniref:Reverse transcriptase domain-containing protein n=1 Tax=Vitis vinifera TaxID=29760 RepID=A0A438DCY9_VITVI|nr:hypothetical protein CK203_105678 [Vitis vinifera]